jgi:hypothetical protein
MNVFRPILRENASAVPYNGGSYSYLVNFSSKTIAVIAAAVTALDSITTVCLHLNMFNSRLLFLPVALVVISLEKSVYPSRTPCLQSSFSCYSHASVCLGFVSRAVSL